MNDNTKPVTLDDVAVFAVNAIAEFCVKLNKEGVSPTLILYALDVNHAMCLRQIMEASFAALKSEQSESQKGG